MGEDGRVSKEIVGLALLEMCCRRVSDERGRTSSTKTLFSVNALLKKKKQHRDTPSNIRTSFNTKFFLI